MGDSPLLENSAPKDTRPDDGSKKFYRSSKPDDMPSTITRDGLIIARKKYYFPNDLVLMLPKKSDTARSPPLGYVALYEMSLQAGLRFPPPPEFIDILSTFEICLSQLSCRAATIIIGLIVFFRVHGTKLTADFLARICRLTCDVQGRISCRCKWLDFRTKDPPRNWSTRYFFVKNEWGLLEQWGNLKDLPTPLHVGEEDVLRVLKFQKVEDLQFEIRYLNKYVNEESLFQVGLSVHAGRSHAQMLKPSDKKAPSPILKLPSKRSLPLHVEGNKSPSKKIKVREPVAEKHSVVVSAPPVEKIHIPAEVLKHSCTGLQRADDLIMKRMDLDLDLNNVLKDWNLEFVKIKYLQSEYKRKFLAKTKEVVDLENRLSECRAELSNLLTSYSLQRLEVDRAQNDIVEARADASVTKKSLETLEVKASSLESENKKLRGTLAEKEATMEKIAAEAGIKAVEEFKESVAFKSIIQDHVQKDRDHIYDVEVKGLERECHEEGFLRGFLKTIRLVNRKTGVDIEGLSPSQVSEDHSSDTEDDAESPSHSSEEDVEID